MSVAASTAVRSAVAASTGVGTGRCRCRPGANRRAELVRRVGCGRSPRPSNSRVGHGRPAAARSGIVDVEAADLELRASADGQGQPDIAEPDDDIRPMPAIGIIGPGRPAIDPTRAAMRSESRRARPLPGVDVAQVDEDIAASRPRLRTGQAREIRPTR